jgi:hypothetical protein
VLVILAILAAIGYAGFASLAIYRQIDRGRQELVAAQAILAAAGGASDPQSLTDTATQLKRAESDFRAAGNRARHDAALRAAGQVALAEHQIDAVAHLAVIGADISRAGESAAAIAIQVAQLRQAYAGRSLTPDTLQTLLGQAQGIAANYAGAARAIGQELRDAHAQRSAVSTSGLLPPLRDAYDQVDAALGEADTAFLRYQNVRRAISDLLGVSIPL